MRWTQEIYLLSPKLISRLKVCFNKYKVPGEFEDFYHDYVEHILLGHGKHQTLDYFTIDQVRKNLGRSGQKKDLLNAIELNKENEAVLDENSYLSCDYIIFVKELLSKHKGRNRIIVILHYVFGHDNEEIGLLLGLSDSRISQILKEIREGKETEDDCIHKENLELMKEVFDLRVKLKKKIF